MRLRWASGLAASAGVTLCVEPLNPKDVPGYLLPDFPSALRILEQVDSPNVRLQLDLYHYAMTEGSGGDGMRHAVRTLLPLAAHVQIANPPDRHEPGVGDVDYPPLFALLDELSFDGYVGCEYKPSTSTEASFGWAKPYGIASG